MKHRIRAPQPALVVAIVALIAALGGSAYAEFGADTVDSAALERGAVSREKLADAAIEGADVAARSISARDIATEELGTVPSAAQARAAKNAGTLAGHAAACPPATELVGGLCFDTSPSGPVRGVLAAADRCAAEGGNLPSVAQLIGARRALDLGDWHGSAALFTDSYFTAGSKAMTIILGAAGARPVPNGDLLSGEVTSRYRYLCAYPLVR